MLDHILVLKFETFAKFVIMTIWCIVVWIHTVEASTIHDVRCEYIFRYTSMVPN